MQFLGAETDYMRETRYLGSCHICQWSGRAASTEIRKSTPGQIRGTWSLQTAVNKSDDPDDSGVSFLHEAAIQSLRAESVASAV